MRNIAIIGAGSHTRSSLNILLQYFNSTEMSIYDKLPIEKEETIHKIKVAGTYKDIPMDSSIFISIGNNHERKSIFDKYKKRILKKNIYHTNSYQEKNFSIGVSNQIFCYSYINSYVNIGDNNIINTYAILEHEVSIGNHNHISVGAKICGRSTIGNSCLVGAGAIISNNINICDNVVIGAGSVVISDITEQGTYVGNPARKIK